MSTPIATSDDLALYLGRTVEQDRATLLLSLAQIKCERFVSPLPAAAKDIVLEVAGRAYNNVASATQIGMGSAFASLAGTGQGGVGGLFLSRSNKAELRRLAGRAGAFSVDFLPRGASEVQAVVVEATAGTFTLALDGVSTSPVAFDATAAVLQAALEAVSTIGVGNVSVADGFLVHFKGALANQAVSTLVADDSATTGTVTVLTVQQGSPPPWAA